MKTILIVEDEPSFVMTLQDNLVAEGYTVDLAKNGDEAMEHITKMRPNLILLDLLMPKKDGFYVLEQVKKNPELKQIPIIVLSNLGGDMSVLGATTDFSAVAMYADDYLIKSQSSIDEIIAMIKDYMEGKKVAKNLPVRD